MYSNSCPHIDIRNRRGWGLILLIATLLLPAVTAWCEEKPNIQFLPAEQTLVPQTLLGIVHAPEVHKEIGLSKEDFNSLLPKLRSIDAVWWPSRNLKPSESRKQVAAQEKILIEHATKLWGEDKVFRLRQLELQAQGFRSLVRPDAALYLRLSPSQSKQLTKLFTETDALAAKAFPTPGSEDANAKELWTKAQQAEAEESVKLLNSDQKVRLGMLVGKSFPTASLQRIFPLAPEFPDSDHWIQGKTSIDELKGKVVLIHFYAFQCSNCKANFPIYNRWKKELASKGVEVIGIQTPETEAESDLAKVTQAALKDQFQFPVLVDLDRKSWDAWANTMWPTVYVLDKEGFIRFWWQGELRWKGATTDAKIEEVVNKLLQE